MSLYRQQLPQLGRHLFLTDGGIETTLIFHEGQELPDFSAFHLLRTADGRDVLTKYFRSYVDLARKEKLDLLLETATWRASHDWGTRLGYDREALARANRESVRLLEVLRPEAGSSRLVISGCIGPRGDGYVPSSTMTPKQARDYHRIQIETFAATAADLVTAITMNYAEEAVGIAQAAQELRVPVVISYTVETDGALPSGESLQDAIDEVDQATGGYPAYYMLNCAHPTHFEETLRTGSASWLDRIHGLRANASRMSHAELNDSPTLDRGNPEELAQQYAKLKGTLKNLNVMGGCCGTDDRHVASIARACAPLFPQ